MSKFKIRKVVPKQSAYPLVCSFQNGELTENFESAQCELCFDGKYESIATVIDGVLYAGNEEVDTDRTFILARNRRTGKVRVVEAGCAVLKPILDVEDVDFTESNESPDAAVNDIGFNQKFGSKTRKKQIEKQERQKTNTEIVEEQLQSYVQNLTENDNNATVDQLDISSFCKIQTDDQYLPPIKRDAAKVEDVYDPKQMFTEELYEKMYSELRNKDNESELLPYLRTFYKLEMSSTHLVLLMYANSLIKLYLSLSKEIAKKNFIVSNNSVTLNEVVLENFTQTLNGKKMRSNSLKDKALCYFVVILLILNNFKFEITEFASLIKLSILTITTKVKIAGAYVVKSGEKKYIQLKLPLNVVNTRKRKSAKF
ncbi:DNA-directed RNA polymerase I subunit rpa49 [Eumeta japonica]|uniref:DNA-directed RNA polymerase I subunit rpa49 n=1 Tax=Eumeta variegata TaxID=151549 RepID=A0A4C1TGB0_EUMVA|nr:DNA-directed RNA polymerase I subunit rpa49 [Eumeta japonica]